ncbi:MAG: hypothetical protein HY805_09765 [Nitrospirae bacterium]|nr:hypothetical protein [Nitrospirota bacterium]
MKRGQGTHEARKIAQRTYLEFGGKNIKAILKRLEDSHDIKMSAQTLLRWAVEGRWKERVKEKIPTAKIDPERMRQVALEILETDYGIKR